LAGAPPQTLLRSLQRSPIDTLAGFKPTSKGRGNKRRRREGRERKGRDRGKEWEGK